MPIAQNIREVFGHFQNLNLLVLIQDLRSREIARHGWSTGTSLCPVAHGLPAGEQVRQLTVLGQTADLDDGCEYAARHLGADPRAVLRFVRAWDEQGLEPTRLLQQLDELWYERLTDAQVMQDLLDVTESDHYFRPTPASALGRNGSLIC
jgi:hypothetical protein